MKLNKAFNVPHLMFSPWHLMDRWRSQIHLDVLMDCRDYNLQPMLYLYQMWNHYRNFDGYKREIDIGKRVREMGKS